MKITLADILPKFVRLECCAAWGALTPAEHAEHVELKELLAQFDAEIETKPDHDRYSKVLTDDKAMDQWRDEEQERREGKRPQATAPW
ncbi:MAG: hypothetical protein HN396_10785 [Gemmatimonadales bacterium]|jgi:hypothetical protein|nr:hypothetical protein [Gemmatimonadales bacterium]